VDQISDALNRIKNAQRARRANTEVVFSKANLELLKIMEREKLIESVEEKGKKGIKKIQVNLRYSDGLPAIEGIRRRSKPSRRLYIQRSEIRTIRQGQGLAIISTSRGLMTDKEAKKAGLGGELICEIW